MNPSNALHSALLASVGFTHAFFTRNAGNNPTIVDGIQKVCRFHGQLPQDVSQHPQRVPTAELNFATHAGDDPHNVAQSLAIAAQNLDVDPERILFLHQVHGTTCHVVAPPFHNNETCKLEGDAIIAHDNSVACSVRVADCPPILLADRRTGLAAAVHSGWRGTEKNIVGHVLAALQRMPTYSGNIGNIVAAVGPHIEACCFETSPDIAMRLSCASSAKDTVSDRKNNAPRVNLRRILQAQLIDAGLRTEQVDHVQGCTMCNASCFFSYRRDGQRSGRLLAAIVPRSGE